MAIRSNYFRRRNLSRIRNSRRLQQFIASEAVRLQLTTAQVYAILQGGNSAELLRELRSWTPATNRASMPYSGLSSGSNLSTTYRARYRTAIAVTSLRFVFTNSRLAAAPSEIDNPNTTTYEATVETGVGTNTVPITFNGGASSVVLGPGQSVVSDPVTITFPANTDFFVRTRCTAAVLGERWPTGRAMVTAQGEGYSATNFLTGTVPALSGANAAAPSAILAPNLLALRNTVGIIGSSSAQGQGDTADEALDVGYLSRACRANGVGFTGLAVGSDTIAKFLATNTRRFQHMRDTGVNVVIFQLGSNDLTSGRTLAQIQGDLKTSWKLLRDFGVDIYQTTYTTSTTSTDSWATMVNQTVHASNPVRQALNAWLYEIRNDREFTRYIDVHTPTEGVGADLGKWVVNGSANFATVDGLHLSPSMHATVASFIGTSLFAQG